MHDLGLTNEAFWRLTPAQFAALVDRYEESQKLHSFRFGMIVSTIRNLMRGKSDKAVTALEVMGYDKEDESSGSANTNAKPVDNKVLAQQEIALRFRLMQAAQRVVAPGGVRG